MVQRMSNVLALMNAMGPRLPAPLVAGSDRAAVSAGLWGCTAVHLLK